MAIRNVFTSYSSALTRALAQERWYAAYSALALVVIQVGIGVVLKAAQTGGQYAFSPSASVTISELLKMLLAGVLFHREWRERNRGPAARAEYRQVDTANRLSSDSDNESLERGRTEEAANSQTSRAEDARDIENQFTNRTFWHALRTEVSIDVIFGLCVLALFYVLINNLVCLFKLPLSLRVHLEDNANLCS